MNLYERWKEDGMRVLCDKDSLKVFEDLGYKLDKSPCEYVAPKVQEVVADLPTEVITPEIEVVPEVEVMPEVVDTDKQTKRGRKTKSQEDVEDKVTGPDIVL